MISDINKLELDVKWQNLTPGCTIVGSCTAEVFRTEERLSPGHRTVSYTHLRAHET